MLSPETERRQEVQEGIGKRMRPRQAYNTEVGTQALPVDTNSEPQLIAASNPQRLGSVTRKDTGVVALKPKRGRPSTGFDKRAYNKQYMADRRAGKR